MDIPASHQLRKVQLKIKALSHPERLKILEILSENNKLTVTEIQFALKISQSATSQHLSQLRKSGYIRSEKLGKNRFYKISKNNLSQDIEWLTALAK